MSEKRKRDRRNAQRALCSRNNEKLRCMLQSMPAGTATCGYFTAALLTTAQRRTLDEICAKSGWRVRETLPEHVGTGYMLERVA